MFSNQWRELLLLLTMSTETSEETVEDIVEDIAEETEEETVEDIAKETEEDQLSIKKEPVESCLFQLFP